MSNYKLKRMFVLLLLPITYIFTSLARSHPDKVELLYSRGFYAVFSSSINTITSFCGFSIAEILVIFAIIAGIIFIIYSVFKICNDGKENRFYNIYTFVINILVIFTLVIFFFNITCGFNYYRPSFVEQIDLKVTNASADQLYDLAKDLANDANKYRENIKIDENGVMILSGNIDSTMDSARKAMNSLAKEYTMLGGMYFQPKPVKNSTMLSRMGISGIFFPFTYEANVNVDCPDVIIPLTMSHELSHLRGFMQEEEANFIGYLACMSSDNNDFKYSGTICALEYALSALSRSDMDKYNEIKSTLSEGVLTDLQHNSDYWYSYRGTINKVSNSINDTYLKANNQTDGVSSYGQMVNLLVAYRSR